MHTIAIRALLLYSASDQLKMQQRASTQQGTTKYEKFINRSEQRASHEATATETQVNHRTFGLVQRTRCTAQESKANRQYTVPCAKERGRVINIVATADKRSIAADISR